MAFGAIMGQQKANPQLSNLSNNQQALYNIGAGVRQNIFINPFFKVNQRGKSSYSISSPAYTLDCWKSSGTTNSGTIGLSGNTVQLRNFNGTMGISQLIEEYSSLAGKTVTVSFLAQITSGQYSIVVNDGTQNTSPDRNFTAGDLTLYSFTVTISNSPSQLQCAFESVNNGNATIYAAKLEIGETQTLAYQDSTGAWNLLSQPESDYVVQLLKCQRYLNVLQANNTCSAFGNGLFINKNTAHIFIPLSVPLRTVPTVSYSGTFDLMLVAGSNFNVSNIVFDQGSSNGIRLKVTISTTATAGNPCYLEAKNDRTAQIILSAEL